MKMIPKKCANPLCDQVFTIASTDFLTRYHSLFCKNDHENKISRCYDFEGDPLFKISKERKDKKCLDMVKSEKMEESGTEVGEQSNNLKEESNAKEKEKNLQLNSKQEERGKETSLLKILEQENVTGNDQEEIITSKEPGPQKENLSGEIKTEREFSPTKEIITQEQIHSQESNRLSTVLNEEKENSIQSLNESSKLLLGFAKSLVKGKMDENEDFIQRPMVSDVGMALQCIDGIRNIQKTKLDFLKFSREIQKGMGKGK